jgi:hypothetical protein
LYYIGRLIYIRYGLFEETSEMDGVLLMTRIKVLDASESGCRISPAFETSNNSNDLFVRGMPQSFCSDREYGAVMIFPTGESFTYATVGGAERRIPLFDWGTDLTQTEYVSRFTRATNIQAISISNTSASTNAPATAMPLSSLSTNATTQK